MGVEGTGFAHARFDRENKVFAPYFRLEQYLLQFVICTSKATLCDNF